MDAQQRRCMLSLSTHGGFTLVELLIVLAILGILATIAIPQFQQYKKRGYVATVTSDAKNAFSASSVFIADHPTWNIPITLANLLDAGFNPSVGVNTSLNSWVSSANYSILSTGSSDWQLTEARTIINQNGQFLIEAKP